MISQPLLITFVGIPGSGKTTFAKKLAGELHAVTFAVDAMRIAMWGSLKEMKAARATPEAKLATNKLTFGAMNYATMQALAAGYSVIFDANANHRHERQEKHDIAREQGALSVVVRIKVPYEISLERIQNRDAADDARQASPKEAPDVLERFSATLEEPGSDENVIHIDGEASFDEQLASFWEQINRFFSANRSF